MIKTILLDIIFLKMQGHNWIRAAFMQWRGNGRKEDGDDTWFPTVEYHPQRHD